MNEAKAHAAAGSKLCIRILDSLDDVEDDRVVIAGLLGAVCTMANHIYGTKASDPKNAGDLFMEKFTEAAAEMMMRTSGGRAQAEYVPRKRKKKAKAARAGGR